MFNDGMKKSFESELSIAGEKIEVDGIEGDAVVDGAMFTEKLTGAIISSNTQFDVYIVTAEFSRLNIGFDSKIKLLERSEVDGPIEGRVSSILPIEGGQYKVTIGPSTDR